MLSRTALCIFAAATLSPALANTFLSPPPAAITGLWQVAKVKSDILATRTLNYGPDDQRLVGRTLRIDAQEINTNLPEGSTCNSPIAQPLHQTLDKILADSMGGTETDGSAIGAKNYQLDKYSDASTITYTLTCKAGNFGPVDQAGSWLATTSGQELLANWFDGSVLVMRKLDTNARPQASFNCAKAQSASEKAICSDIDLAAYDKSVSRSWQLAKQEAVSVGNKIWAAKLASTQKAWLEKRNQCNADKNCLQQSMVKRLDELSVTEEE